MTTSTDPTDRTSTPNAARANGAAQPTLRGDHSVLVGAVDAYAGDLLAAIDAGDAQAFGAAHGTLAAWCQFELVPALAALEQDLYPLATGSADLLRQALVADHRVAAGLVDSVNAASDAARLAGDATALRVVVRATLAKVDELLVPAVAGLVDPQALADAVASVPRTAAALSAEYAAAVRSDVDAAHATVESGCGGGGCGGGGCGGGGCGGGGICGSSPDDHRSADQKAADRDAVTVTRVD